MDPPKLSEVRLRKKEEDYQAEWQAISDLRESSEKLQEDLQSARTQLYEISRAQRTAEHALELALAKSESIDDDIPQRRSLLAIQKRENDKKKAELAANRKKFGESLEKAHEAIAAIADQIVEVFSAYASAFLVEQCQLSYQMNQRLIGQGGVKLNFPSFELEMTSSLLPFPAPREASSDVSESQKEFIDLAFRMAILAALPKESGSLLVIETPESSLDSLFVDRAGMMLHKFARVVGGKRNQVVCTSNLNRENMIPAILGLSDSEGKVKAASAIQEKRIINLLKLAAPSRAYLEFKSKYDRAYEHALGR